MNYPEADFEIDTARLTISHKPSGTIFRFSDYPDPVKGNEVNVSFPEDVCESELPGMCNAAGLHLKAQLDRTRS